MKFDKEQVKEHFKTNFKKYSIVLGITLISGIVSYVLYKKYKQYKKED